MLRIRCAALLLMIAAVAHGQPGSAAEPVRYTGSTIITSDAHDGNLRPAIGIENIQVLRANRSRAGSADEFGWTYNHAPMLAYWDGRFYLQYLSNPVGEHVPPGQTLVATSVDGRNWAKPRVVFPVYDLPEGGQAMMHQRMGFYIAPNGRLLVLAFYGQAPNPFGKGGIGRVVREAYKDGSYGPIYFIKYNRHAGAGETNTRFPFYKTSPDKGFLEACEALLANRLVTLNWYQEDQNPNDEFYALRVPLQALSFYHRKDGAAVGLWKASMGALTFDEGKTWTTPVKVSTFVMDGAKVWGQRTSDGRYAIVYNPIDDGTHRWPLAVVTGEDGVSFDNILAVHGEVPPRRYAGRAKDFGPQYMRGITEGNGTPPGGELWLTYSMNKEDIWIARVPVPVRWRVESPVDDSFEDLPVRGAVRDWNIYASKWAVPAVEPSPAGPGRSLKLEDRDPYDYARAVRVFPESKTVRVSARIFADQTDRGELHIEVQDAAGRRPVRVALSPWGALTANGGPAQARAGQYQAKRWYRFDFVIRSGEGNYDLSIDGKPVMTKAALAEPVSTVERLSFRTGEDRVLPTRSTDRLLGADLPGADDPVPAAVFFIDDVKVSKE